MRCVDNSKKHINYEYGNGIKLFKNIHSKYGFWHNCSKTCIQILDRAQLFKTHSFKNGVVGGMQPYKIFSVLLGLSNKENTN